MANTSNAVSPYPLYEEDANDPDVIRSQIARTRAQMGETIDQIQARLAPEQLKHQAQEAIREATLEKVEEMKMSVEQKARNWRSGLVHTIRENPVPAALVGIGLGWLMMSNKEDDNYPAYYQERNGRHFNGGSDYRPYYAHYPREAEQYGQYGEDETMQARVGEAVEDVQERVGEMTDQARQRVSSLAHDAREQVRGTADHLGNRADHLTQEARARAEEMRFQTRMGVYRAKRTFSDTLEENPMAVAVAALAAGALVGMVLPSTPIENQLLGETRDRMMDEARSVAQDATERVKHVAQEAQHAAVDTAKCTAEKEWQSADGDSTTTTTTTESWSSS